MMRIPAHFPASPQSFNMSNDIQTARTAAGLHLMLPHDKDAPEIGNALAVILHKPLAAVHPTIALAATANMARRPVSGARNLTLLMTGLRILSAVGDGIPGHPWIKGSAGIALEILGRFMKLCISLPKV
ncbi:hypothetical protein HYPSUDRAFT_972677 [Hypholoma sublateritium FD-334 SS-4]|uniref:Uncharacterized protein n=1 Tax=Hypholoma sublateritium (strain FD-334 SS-4) TaxID=945553 RepID=A0A0D2NG58_HYPSF|nr:hypothetical protein HYPSUDRAFT_972677 [Hypholoma sublateritium FD-334 SS-4]